ncbi:MAG: Na+/H+ antiporter subunit E [Candidatus Eisenbacteria bacterium]|uniref:Na+/H+ antiporter subunit E n=1 Tax=Eiseniibacteriota bacterium TaxID=2212470 RepID=A0A938BS26_UNCEI|nr:Na+/H+ antiporter subunit E [Candidatus Eisenbacteria bacterium]
MDRPAAGEEQGEQRGEGIRARLGAPSRPVQSLLLFLMLSAFWFVLSGKIGVPYFAMMALAVGAVVAMIRDHPFGRRDPSAPFRPAVLPRAIFHLVRYLLWLVWSIARANIDVARLILSPRMRVDPRLLTFQCGLAGPVPQVIMGNSITLTPGTLTIDIRDGRFLVHALVPASAASIASGEVQRAVGRLYSDTPGEAPTLHWHHSITEIEP